MRTRWKVLIIVALLVTVLDQWTKFLALKHLTPAFAQAKLGTEQYIPRAKVEETIAGMSLGEQLSAFYASDVQHPCKQTGAICPRIKVVDGFWNHIYVENPGAAWGMLAKSDESFRVPFFFTISVVVFAFIIMVFRKLESHQKILITALSLVMGGAIGNFIDRLHLSYVIDFIDWYVGTKHWPTFNIADSAITVGMAFLVLDWALEAMGKKPEEQPRAS